MGTSVYKSNESRYRVMTSENTFSAGMQYTDNPLSEGSAKVLVNYQLANNGTTLKPRAGYNLVEENVAVCLAPEDSDYIIHHTAQAYVQSSDERDAYLCRYTLFGAIYDATYEETVLGMPKSLFSLAEAKVTIMYSGKAMSTTEPCTIDVKDVNGTDRYFLTLTPAPENIHNVPVLVGHSRNGVYTSMDNNTYVPVIHTWYEGELFHMERFICLLRMQFDATKQKVSFKLRKLKANDITAVQAVNYGYNMLLAEPYKFTNKAISTSTIILDGIVPYDANGNLLTSARAGAEIFFHLVYRYPQADVDAGKRYYVQWEIQDLASNSEPQVLRSVRSSEAYTPGEDIFIRTTQTTYKQFVLSAKIYYKDIVDAAVYEDNELSDELNDALFLKPEQVMTIAYYYLTADTDSSTLNVNAATYDLCTATGMCTWQQRIVLWGVQNAKNTLWVSEVNDPSWFPYPNNCEIFGDDIIACVPYKTELLVFTKSALYKLSFLEDGLTYTTTCVQERLNMNEEDAGSIIPVQSMVFFKNANYYYMIVPITGSATGELQLAPITRPIEYLLDNFESGCIDLLDTLLYDEVNLVSTQNTLRYNLFDWWCRLEQKLLKITYKIRVTVDEKYYTYVDLVFVYDTQLRTWTLELFESTEYRMLTFIPSVTTDTIYVMPVRISHAGTALNLIQQQATNPVDSFPLDFASPNTFQTVHYIDTGYRNMLADVKKRFRQIQFRVTNTYSQHLKFFTTFRVDNDLRKGIYRYETDTITDPEAEDYGSIYVSQYLEDPDEVDSLLDKQAECAEWGVDLSRFPDVNTAHVKLNVSGKGRMGRFTIKSSNTSMYEISNMLWVYRAMYGR